MDADRLREVLQEWMEANALAEDSRWWRPEEFFGDKFAEYVERPCLVLTFDGDLHDVLWSWVSDTTDGARLRREFEGLVKQHGFAIRRKSYTCIYFVESVPVAA